MSELKQIYKCNLCGNIVEVLHEGQGALICCGQNMELLLEKSNDKGFEKHVPIIENTSDGILVKVGEIEHVMEEKHYIEWIELHTKNYLYRKYLNPAEKPQALFKTTEEPLYAREYCNIHGLWKSNK